MKVSVIISFVIIAIATLLGWKNHEELKQVRIEHRLVVDEAAEFGISVEEGGDIGLLRRPIERGGSANREAEMKSFSAELIAFAKKLEDREGDGGPEDEAIHQETMEMIVRFLDLDEKQLKEVIADLKASQDLGDDMRQGIIGFSIMMLGNESPEVALTIYTESSDILVIEGLGEHVVKSSLSRLAEKDPFAAMDWIRENGEKNPELVSESVKSAVIEGTARQDRAMAINLMKELQMEDDQQAAAAIARSADTSEKRLQLLVTLRALDGDSKEIQKSVLGAMGEQLQKDGYEASVVWLETANLKRQELDFFSTNLSYQNTKEDTGKWLGWVEESFPANEASNKTAEMMQQWTQNDFKAAGNWLNDAKEGQIKEAAVESYAKTVAPYEPQAAAQWALTLPEGSQRSELIKQVYRDWMKKDEAAAAAFAAEQGID
jgi:hypothetical protein